MLTLPRVRLPRRVRFDLGTFASAGFKAALFAAALVFVSPPLRQRAAPVVRPLFDPLLRVTTKDRVERVAAFLEVEVRRTGEAPLPRDLPAALQRLFPGRDDTRVDPWGRHFYLRRRALGFEIGSAGPDGRRGTRDDVLSRLRSIAPSRSASHGE